MKTCERCKQKFPSMNIFLCKGLMVCEGCYMTMTEGNTKFFDEALYPRKKWRD
jgi:hypothetical protein